MNLTGSEFLNITPLAHLTEIYEIKKSETYIRSNNQIRRDIEGIWASKSELPGVIACL